MRWLEGNLTTKNLLLPRKSKPFMFIRFLLNEDALEKDRMYLFSDRTDQNLVTSPKHLEFTVDVCGVLLPHEKLFNKDYKKHISTSTLVQTPSAKAVLADMAIALSCGLPILLEGATGSGKTSLIEEAGRMVGSNGILTA